MKVFFFRSVLGHVGRLQLISYLEVNPLGLKVSPIVTRPASVDLKVEHILTPDAEVSSSRFGPAPTIAAQHLSISRQVRSHVNRSRDGGTRIPPGDQCRHLTGSARTNQHGGNRVHRLRQRETSTSSAHTQAACTSL